MKPAYYMTLDALKAELADVTKQWDEMHADPDFEGFGGSPGEWMVERMGELETEIKRRGTNLCSGTKRRSFQSGYDHANIPCKGCKACL